MNQDLNLPEKIEPGSHYSFRTDMKVNGWSWVAVATSFIGEALLLPHHKDWPIALRMVVVIVPLMASALWIRSVMRWLRGMDELQRRVTSAACLFSTVSTLFVIATSHLLIVAGVVPARFLPNAGFVIIWLVVCFYIAGRGIFNRRYL